MVESLGFRAMPALHNRFHRLTGSLDMKYLHDCRHHFISDGAARNERDSWIVLVFLQSRVIDDEIFSFAKVLFIIRVFGAAEHKCRHAMKGDDPIPKMIFLPKISESFKMAGGT